MRTGRNVREEMKWCLFEGAVACSRETEILWVRADRETS
jgi:hypothetical protein